MLIDELNKLEKIVNSELTSKIISSKIENEELKIEVESDELNNVIKFLKSDDRCKFSQLIDIAGVDKRPPSPTQHRFTPLAANNGIIFCMASLL